MTEIVKEFYENINRKSVYTTENDPSSHPFYPLLLTFISKWNLRRGKRCLEIGSSKGLFQDLVEDYTGVDIADSLHSYYHKNFVVVADAKLPFPDNSFDAIFTYATYEHIPDIETALEELVRILKPGGVCLFAPAWHTRPWFAEGLAVRPYSGLSMGQKVRKFLIPLRDAVLLRYPYVLLRRLFHLLIFVIDKKQKPLRYRRLRANYEVYWQSDSDACNSLDPFDVIVWFRSRGLACPSYDSLHSMLLARAPSIEVRKPSLDTA